MERFFTSAFAMVFVYVSLAQEADETSSKTTESDEVFMHVDLPAEFPGGAIAENRYLGQSLIIPDNVGDVNGKVFFEFIVEKNGELSNVKLIRGLVPSVDKVAAEVVKNMPKWEPAFLNGIPVRQRVQYSIAVKRLKKSP